MTTGNDEKLQLDISALKEKLNIVLSNPQTRVVYPVSNDYDRNFNSKFSSIASWVGTGVPTKKRIFSRVERSFAFAKHVIFDNLYDCHPNQQRIQRKNNYTLHRNFPICPPYYSQSYYTECGKHSSFWSSAHLKNMITDKWLAHGISMMVMMNIKTRKPMKVLPTVKELIDDHWNNLFPKTLKTKYYNLKNALINDMKMLNELKQNVNKNILYSYSPNCRNLNEIQSIRGKTQSFGLNITSSSHINITDIIMFATGFNIDKSQYITLENMIFSYSSYSKRLLGDVSGPIPSYATHITNLTVINCVFSSSDSQPIETSGTIQTLYFNNLFEYNGYSCVTPYGTRESPSPVAGSIQGADKFIQNTVENYGPSIGYKAGAASLAYMNYFANQSNLQHDGGQIQVGPGAQNQTKLIQNWSYNTLKYGYRFDGCSPNSNDNTNCGYNCTISHCVSFNDQSIMIKGDNHSVLNNIGFNATMSNGNKADSSNDPAICIRHLSHNWTNTHTVTMNNGADSFMINGSNNGCLYPIVGYASNNIQGLVEPQLIDANNFDFRPKPGSDYAKQYIGPYLINDTYYWIPGRKSDETSFPIPKHNGILKYRCDCDDDDCKYIELIWRMGYKSSFHIGKIFDSKYNMIEKREFVGKQNIWKIKIRNDVVSNAYDDTRYTYFYWSVDSVMDDTQIVYKGQLWKFLLTDECI
eukprot:362783_1